MLSRNMLERQRAAQRRLMPGRADLEEAVRTDDGFGGQTTEWQAVERGVAFRVMPGGSSMENLDRVVVAKLGSRVGFQATLDAAVSVTSDMRVHQRQPVEAFYEVLQVQNAGASHVTAARLLVAKFNNE